MRVPLALVILAVNAAGAAAADPITFKAHKGDTWRLSFSPDSKTLFTSSHGDNVMRMWDVATAKLVREFPEIDHGISSIDTSPDGKRVLTSSWNNMLRIWDIRSGELVRTINAPGGVITSAVFSPDGGNIAVAFKEQRDVFVCDTETGEAIVSLVAPMDKPEEGSAGWSQVCFSPDGKTLLAALGGRGWPDFKGLDSVLTVWNTDTWKVRASFPADAHNIFRLSVSPDGKWIAAACHRSQVVKVWQMPEAAAEAKEEAADAATIDKLIKQLDSDDFGTREAADARLRKIGPAAKEALEKVATGGSSAETRFRVRSILTDMAAQEGTAPVHELEVKGLDIHSVAFSPDGKTLAGGSCVKAPRNLTLWQLGDPPKAIHVPNANGTWSVAFSPDGKMLATGNAEEGTVSLWDVKTLLGD